MSSKTNDTGAAPAATSDIVITQLADQLDFHWTNQLRPRFDGLTDDEYFWAPVPNCWTVHPDGGIDFDYPAPEPAPFTTIAWRLAHVIVGVLASAQPLALRRPARRLPELAVRDGCGDRAGSARRRLRKMDGGCARAHRR